MQHRLSPCAATEIDQLESEGIKLTVHDIIHIAALGELVMNPQTRQELARGRPVPVGGTNLWPLTLSASDWWRRLGSTLTIGVLPQRIESQRLVLAYAMAHGHEPLPEDPREAVKIIKEWRRTKLHCTDKALKVAIDLVQEQDVILDSDKDADPATHGELALALAALTGGPPGVWEYQCSMSFIFDVIETISAQALADGKSVKDHRSTKALKALGLAVHRIRERHKREEDG